MPCRRSREVTAILSGLSLAYAALVAWSWARWGDMLVDSGTAVDRAARVAAGQVLYRDVLSPYGPVATEAMAAAFRVFGTHLSTVYGISVALLYGQGVMLWYVGLGVLGAWESAFGVLMFWALLAVQPVLTSWLLPNTFASTFGPFFATATLALAISDQRSPRPWKPVAASVLAALAGLTKVEFGTVAVGVLLLSVWLSDRTVGERRRAVLGALLPGGLITLSVALWLCWTVPFDRLLHDNLYRTRTLDSVVRATRGWADMPLWPRVQEAAIRYGLELPIRAAAMVWAVALLRAGGVRRVLGPLLFLAAALVPFVSGYPQPVEFFGLRAGLHYYWGAVAWACVGVVAALEVRRSRSTEARAVVLIAGFAVLLSLRWNFRIRLASYYGFVGPMLLLLMVRGIGSWILRRPIPQWAVVAVFVVPFVTAQAVNMEAFRRRSTAITFPRGTILDVPTRAVPMSRLIDVIRRRTRPSDFVAVLPEERMINFLSERRNPTRDSGIGPNWLATKDDERQYLAELAVHAPAMVVRSDRRFWEFGVGTLESYNPLVAAYLDEHYRNSQTIRVGRRRFDLLVRRR